MFLSHMVQSMARRTVAGIILSRGGCSITFREQNYNDKDIRYCSRLGCSANLPSINDTKARDQEKAFLGSFKSFPSVFRTTQREEWSTKSKQVKDAAKSSNGPGESTKAKCSRRSVEIKDSESIRRHWKKEKSHSVLESSQVKTKKNRCISQNTTRELRSSGTELSARASKSIIASVEDSNTSSYVITSDSEYSLENLGQTGKLSDKRSVRTRMDKRKRSFQRGSRGKSMSPPSNQIKLAASDEGTQQLQCKPGEVPHISVGSSTPLHPVWQEQQQHRSTIRVAPGSHVSDCPFQDSYDHSHFNIVLSAIQRIKHEISYERGSYHSVYDSQNFHDQYRDMRMDIDDMSYEELLALEEIMGTVSTALTEEALSKCLKISQYVSGSTLSGGSGIFEHHSKCNICQEEFADGDELGVLVCEHIYHETCIHKWLQMKNWCPTCKASAVLPS